jgi:hypothetical protein
VILEVTQADIDGATPGSVGDCPIARAAKRTTGNDDVVFGDDYGEWLLGIGGRMYEAPEEAGEFACRFDRHKSVVPRTFKFPDEEYVMEEYDDDDDESEEADPEHMEGDPA